jgi:hypothetical protein
MGLSVTSINDAEISIRNELSEVKRSIDIRMSDLTREVEYCCAFSSGSGTLYEFRRNSPLEGIIYDLTKRCGKNVSEACVVDVRGSSVVDSEAKYVADLTSVSCFCSVNVPNQWICYDFNHHQVIATHYSIMTSGSIGVPRSHHPRMWVVEGSSDGRRWNILGEEKANEYLNGIDRCRTFLISRRKPVCHIRFRQTGPNHGGDHRLCIKSFELFGTFIEV